MNYLSAADVSRRLGERILFEGLSFGLTKGDKAALVADNGTGKSTLLRILVGEEAPDAGSVALRDGVRLGYLPQEPTFGEATTLRALVYGAGGALAEAATAYEAALARQATDFSEASQRALEKATAAMDQLQAWDYARRTQEMLDRFGLTDLDRLVDTLSGGQRKRLALALLLLDEPDLLLLDEPTNHLDLDMIEWLERYLGQSSVTLLMVTHDRYFLDRVCNQIFELNGGKLYRHAGNFTYFLEKRAEREAVEQTEIDKAGKLYQKELEWMRRMPKARSTKAKYRVDAFRETEAKAKSGSTAGQVEVGAGMARLGRKILELSNVSKRFGAQPLLQDFSYTFKRGERIGIVGPNGAGKSTFLNLITEQLPPDAGEITKGETVVFGYYAQQGIDLPADRRVIEVIQDIAEVLPQQDGGALTPSQLLQKFLFPPERQYTYVSKLSGGERRRLYLLTVLIRQPNFLILDEPTNDLDLLTLAQLEAFLADFGGCLLVVTHDRYFMDKLVDHLFIFEGGGRVQDFNGTYRDYRAAHPAVSPAKGRPPEKEAPASQTSAEPPPTKRKRSYREQQEYEQLEKDIEALEAEKAEIEATLARGDQDYDAIARLSERVGEIVEALDEKTMRWLELDEVGA